MLLLKGSLKSWQRNFLFIVLLYIRRTALGEACDGDVFFADSLEAFGGGQDDPVSVSIGGCLGSKF